MLLHDFEIGNASRRVRILLAEKGSRFPSRRWTSSPAKHVRRIPPPQPPGQVPVLVPTTVRS